MRARAQVPRWAARLAALGVAPPPILRRNLNADVLSAAIEATAGDQMRARAAALGAAVRAEDGVSAAVDFIERVVAGSAFENAGARPTTRSP